MGYAAETFLMAACWCCGALFALFGELFLVVFGYATGEEGGHFEGSFAVADFGEA